jgi:hypothetical protein
MVDEFSAYYADFLDGTYNCVDRIVLNAYLPMGQSPGGFRTWWRQLEGSDDHLDNAHLMRMAGRFSRRVHAHAQAHQIPIRDCAAGERKHELAEQSLPTDPNFVGVFLILVNRAPAPLWDVQCSKQGKIVNLERKKPWPYVKHYSFHIIDREWGHLTIKLSGHPPFGAQISLNGHEYVARQAMQRGIAFTKESNCFTQIAEPARLAQVADTLCASDTIGRLRQVCERWIYSACLCFVLDLAEQERSRFQYDYSLYQAEYSRNLLFTRGGAMDQVFQGVIDRTRRRLDVKTLRTLFGYKKRPVRSRRQPEPRCEVVLERPVYDLTIFKIHWGKLTVKLYTKGEHVLRSEVIVHNTRALHCGRALAKFAVSIARLKDILIHFLNGLRCVDSAAIADDQLDEWPKSSAVGQTRVGGVDINKPRMRAVLEAVITLSANPSGFSSSEVAAQVRAIITAQDAEYTARQAAYDLKKLRGKDLVRKLGSSRRYESVPTGLQAMTALLILREKVIKPVLAGAGKPKLGRTPKQPDPIDTQYEIIRADLRHLFDIIGLAA